MDNECGSPWCVQRTISQFGWISKLLTLKESAYKGVLVSSSSDKELVDKPKLEIEHFWGIWEIFGYSKSILGFNESNLAPS